MFRPINALTGGCLLLAALSTPVAAADDAEFAFNLLSDIAPILALFGDQFAKQFTSESLTWVDHLIFAMVPLGIITAITGAIRVQGMQVAKAFIGRSRENRALAEIELMSSTSGEVCELFNGNSIVRSMGKPKIGQILIFPDEYDSLKKTYESFDEALGASGEESTEGECRTEEPENKSCGIHTLRTATSKETGTFPLMECEPYSSYSAALIQTRMQSAFDLFRDLWRDTPGTLKKLFRSPSLPRDEEKIESIDHPETVYVEPNNSVLHPEAEPALSGPPNLQLNLSSNHFDERKLTKRHEIFLAGFAAVLLQTGLIAVAAVTAYYLSAGSSNLLESKVYGFPCYAAGSLLLSIGTGLCSLTVEHSTIEHSWVAKGAKRNAEPKMHAKITARSAPRLLWIQQYQTVNDQSFKSYAILAGPKRRVITSRRDDDLRKHQLQDDQAPTTDNTNKVFWEWLTVGAALSASIGFTAQFMGLRGLAFPCSIAQLGAIFIMALIRAGIRRRLGRVPAYCSALDGYELDFLATQIVCFPDFRNFNPSNPEAKGYGTTILPSGSCEWKVRTPDIKQSDGHFARSDGKGTDPKATEQFTATKSKRQEPEESDHKTEDHISGLNFEASSSQQLLRVRERLGDLCDFTSKSTQSALSLAQSIELFMETFFPSSPSWTLEANGKDYLPHFNWLVEVTPVSESESPDWVKIPVIRRKSDLKWEADIGKIDAILSLWMASLETKRFKDRSTRLGDWRRRKAGDDLTYNFGRIIGDNLEDNVLMRDISWWVESLIAEQSIAASDDDKNSADSNEASERTERRRTSRARSNQLDLVIGFNGYKQPEEEIFFQELGIVSKASLQTILAQHLFTSFMWTVAKLLPRDCLDLGPDDVKQEVEIEGHQTFHSYDFDQAWYRPRLRHRKLTKAIRSMESYGLGTATDILLCVIPAFSLNRLLPNQAILKLMPHVHVGSGHGWVETAICHKKLLEKIIKATTVSTDDKLAVAAAVASIDFLSSALEPYDDQLKPPPNLSQELEIIKEYLNSTKFAIMMEKLAPVYIRQHRKSSIHMIKKLEAGGIGDLDRHFAKDSLGFTQHHLAMFSTEDTTTKKETLSETEKSTNVRDVFGWTPYHYGCFDDGFLYNIFWSVPEASWVERLHTLTDNLGRSPVHIAALSGKRFSLRLMLSRLSTEGLKIVLHGGGFDGMTPFHLAAKGGSSRLGHEEVISKLLEMGARSDELDQAGNYPVDYFVENATKESGEIAAQEEDKSGSAATDWHEIQAKEMRYLRRESFDLLLRFAMDPSCRYGYGKSFLHIAVEIADEDSIRTLQGMKFDIEARDKDGRTPLHYAIRFGRTKVFDILRNGFQANLQAKDSGSITALMFAAQKNLKEVAEALLASSKPSTLNEVDSNKMAAIRHAGGREVAELLVSENCNVLATDSNGRTALHTAIEKGERDVTLYLLGLRGPSQMQTNPFDSNNESLLFTACKLGLSKIVIEVLKQ